MSVTANLTQPVNLKIAGNACKNKLVGVSFNGLAKQNNLA